MCPAPFNAGDPDFVPASNETDLDGQPRVLCEGVDIGAHDFGVGDYDCDLTVNLTDFAGWQDCVSGPIPSSYAPGCEAFDFDANGAIELLDFSELIGTLAAPDP